MVVKVNDVMKDYPLFKVACMKTPLDKTLTVHNVRCADVKQLYEFLPRLFEVGDIDTLYFLEIIMHASNGDTAFVRTSSIPWPKVTTDIKQGIVAPKPIKDNVAKEVDRIIKEQRKQAAAPVAPAVPPPPPTASYPDKPCRKVIPYTIKVA